MSWVGLDIGGTRLKGGLLDEDRRIVTRDFEPAQPGQSLRAFEQQLDRLVARLVRRDRSTLQGIGASITGPVNPELGCVHLPGKIRGLDRHRTVPYLRRRWSVPVCADNDGRLACYAEWQAGAGRGVDNLLVFTLGTGIGSGVVLDGRLLTDRHFLRGTQCGHMVIDIDGPRCLTGARGTGESLASITALVQDVRSHVARGLPTKLAGRAVHEIGFTDIVTAVRRKDRIVTEIFERWIDRFSATILNSFYAYTPDLILLAGGPTRAAGIFRQKLETRLNATAFRVPVGYRIPIRIAKLGEDASWFGAALFARDRFGGEGIAKDSPPEKKT
jgi:glucokinase